MYFSGLFLSLLWLTGAVEAGWFSKSKVREISARNFNADVIKSGNVSMVLFYEPWCPHCKDTAPELKKSAKALQGLVNVFAVNCQLDVNKELCVSQKIEKLPTIKAFQPAKLTDVDFKDVVEGKPLKLKKPRVFSYNGQREAKAFNKFATSKIRNYAASLANENAISWFKLNKIPRVIMLPGSKYKSKSIAPLFKVLSNDYFGKLRFAYVPRRVDGAWSLLGLPAVEQSQLVYMSDDKEPVVYLGDLHKRAVKKFIDEQYSLEMTRRQQRDLPLVPDREEAANGLEWIIEDAQEEEMEHVKSAREEIEADHIYVKLSQAQAEEELRKERAEAAGKKYVPREINEEKIRSELEEKRSSLSAEVSVAKAKATAEALGLKEGEEITEEQRIILDGEVAEEFVYDGPLDDTAEALPVEDVEVDEEAANIDDSDDAQESVDAMLDEIDIDLLPNEVVEEGPEAISSYQAKMLSLQAAQSKSASGAAKPKVTPSAKQRKHDYLESISDVVRNCIRSNKLCLLMATNQEFADDDKQKLLIARSKISGITNEKLIFNYFRYDDSEELKGMYDKLGFKPQYFRISRTDKKTEVPQAMVAIFDYEKGKMAHMTAEYTDAHIIKLIVDYFNKKVTTAPIPKEYRLMVTKEDIELLGTLDDEEEGHDEL
ncbi:Protein disulfide-isomerase MPD1 [Wickerhamiella sorbophila]|uniref:Protein disulfide-isomerase MPD1 n=1 Tax=Wickerhamiella sorbophila TaxID=45607 RepID=A0A2T0FIU9_9ASCO|nr:Protein disulfide-isomerase MPD1 [Wickerhamiella sorbophila]PRT54896.1 Protein disulfide-isomerase MPD1 [Wickerhamiella sorbophila]